MYNEKDSVCLLLLEVFTPAYEKASCILMTDSIAQWIELENV